MARLLFLSPVSHKNARHVRFAENTDYPNQQAIYDPSIQPHLPPDVSEGITLTRLGSELHFDVKSSCPVNSLMRVLRSTDIRPLHTKCPKLFIVGVRKGGSTSLIQYISKHPDFKGVLLNRGPKAGETFYFSKWYDTKSWKEYLSNFPSNVNMTGESSVDNLVYCAAPRRIFEDCGKKTKVVMLFRNPVDRFVSSFVMRVTRGFMSNQSTMAAFVKKHVMAFEQQLLKRTIRPTNLTNMWTNAFCLFNPSRNAIYEGVYYLHLANWLCNFPAENIMIINSEEFYQNTTTTLKQVFRFVGLKSLDDDTLGSIAGSSYNPGSYHLLQNNTQTLSSLDRLRLVKLYEPYNGALFQLLNWNTVTWK